MDFIFEAYPHLNTFNKSATNISGHLHKTRAQKSRIASQTHAVNIIISRRQIDMYRNK